MTSIFTKINQKSIKLVRLSLMLVLWLTWLNASRAQSMGYSFANSTGTYTPITGGTVHSSGSLMDDATFSVTLPFTFTFNGTAYTQVYVSENGYVSFGSTDPGTTTRSAISSTNTGFELASPFSGDMQGISTSEMRSQTIGTAPNRTFIAQWTNLQFYLGSGQSFNFQVQLDEANGVIINQVVRFAYGSVSNTSSSTVQVGLRGINNTLYQNRTTSTAWNSTTAGTANSSACTISSTVAPASGLTYTWTPLPQTYTSSTTIQNTNLITPGSTDQQIIGIQIVTAGGSASPLSLTALNLSTAGSTNVGDISNAKVYYTGTNATFSTTTQYGSTVTSPSGAFTVSGAQNLAVGTNYFWLAYDVSSAALIGNVLDAQCTQITLSSNNYVPTVTNPTGSRAISVPFAGNYNIGAGQTYTTLTAAVNALNSAGMTAPVTFTLIDATYSTSETFPIVINQLSGSSATNTLTIKPSSGNIPVITGSAASLITLNGADNIIIDGSAYSNNSREMTFINNSTSTSAVIFISSLGTGLGARNVTIQNCNIQAGSSTATGCIGIYAGGTTISTTGTGADNDKLSIINNAVTKAYYGIYCRGVASTGMLDTLVIANNTIGSNTSNAVVLFDGIDVQNATLSSVYNNTIFNMTQTSGISTNPVAINLAGTLVTTNIYNNIIDGVRNPSSGGWGAYGINLAGTITTANIYNNAISNISTMNYSTSSTTYNAFGIRITVAGTFNLYNNSINLYGPVPNVGSTAHMSACLLAIAGTSINMRNNVFVNSQTGLTGAKSYAIYSTVAVTAYATTTNRNDYFVSGSNGVLGFIAATDQTTLSAWKTVMGPQRDSISVNTDPLFNSNSIIRPTALSPLLNAGAPLSIVTTDLRGVTRNASTPSIGAYEEGGEYIPPVITFIPLTNATSTSNRVLTGFANITDTSGINITASTRPRIYFKKTSNANAFVGNTSADNGWKWVESSNTTSPFNFTINYSLLTGGSVTPGDQIQYFVVAQDLAATPNVTVVNNNFIRTAPNSVDLTSASFPIYGFNSYSIALQLSGNINVGAGQTYTSLTNTGGLFEAINNNVVGGNINALITSDITETGTNALNQTSENGTGNYTITIAPSAATLRTISGAFAGGLVRLNGADRIVIDGRFSGSGNFLTFQNTQASGTTGCIQLMSLGNGLGCVNTTVRNCNFVMPRTGVASGAIFAGGLSINTAGSDNDSISLINNYIQSAAAGFVLSGNTGFENDFITISGNTIDTVSQAGLNMSNARLFTISNNNINNVIGATGVVIAGVSLSSNVRNGVIAQNTISNVLSLDQNAFGVSMGTNDSNIVFNRNIIKRVVHTGVSGWGGKGIDVNTGLASSAIRIFNNMVSGVTGDGYSTVTADANIGIRINGATGGISVYYNTVNMYGNANRSGATADISAAFAVASTSASNLDVRNNIFRNSLVNATGVQKSYAIYHAGTNGSQFSNLAYNNYVVGGSQGVMAFINAADVTNLGAWKTVTTKDSLSQSKAVNFIDSVNLRLTGASLGDYYLRALPIAGVTTDFDNANRNSAVTYMGMFEGTPALTMTANAGTDKITCAGVGVQIGSAIIITGGIAPYTYSWNPAATAVSNPTVSPTSTTSYVVTVTDTFGFSAIDTVVVTVNPVIANNTLTGNQTICSGNTPTGLTGTTPTGGTGTYTYTWLSSTSSATTGFAAASGTNNTQNYSPGALTANTWYRRRVSSGVCNADTSAAVAVTVNPVIAGNTIGSNQSIVSGTTPTGLTGALPTGGTGTYTYTWLVSTTSATAGFSAIASSNTQNYSPGSLTVNTWYRRLVVSGSCSDTSSAVAISVIGAIANNTISGASTICTSSTPTGLTGALPTGGTGTYTYTWLSSTTSATAGFAAASGTNNTQNYSPGSLTQTTWFRRYVVSGAASDTSAAVTVTVNTPGVWGGTVSTAWNNIANWTCPQIPTSTTNVSIGSGATNMPTITDAQQCNNLTINSGATLTLTGASAQLNIFGSFTNNGTFTNTSTGKTVFSGSAQQTVPAGNYTKLQINNAAGVVLGGAVTLSDSLVLSNGTITLGANNLTLGTTSYASAGNASSYIKTNGAGSVIVNGVGSTGKTGNVIIPVGNTTYNPATLLNTGTTDNFTIRLFDSVTTNYTGSAATGAKLTSNALNRTWIINEGTAGGSNATVTLQWNTADELSGFTRALCYVARYNGTVWTSTTATAATGSNPYTQTRSGITSFSPFSVGSGGTLPVAMLDFTGHKVKESVILNWSTASEINNDYFIVERSIDNNTFEAINEKIKGQGNSNNINQYNSIDFDAVNYASTNNSSVIYYRLRQVDFDGTVNYAKPISVSINKTDLVFDATVSPNPFYANLNLNISTTTNAAIDIEMVDIRGVVAHKETLQTVLGSSLYSLDNLSGLANGMYFVKVTQGNNVKVIKLNKIQ